MKFLRSKHARTRLRRDLAVTWRVATLIECQGRVYYRSGLGPLSLSRVIVGLQRKSLPPVGFCRSPQQRRLHPLLLSLHNINRRHHRPADPPTTNKSPMGAPPPTCHWTSRMIPRNSKSERELHIPRYHANVGGEGCVVHAVSCCRAGTREVHNKLEKNRRAHLKECFELLKRQLPVSQDEKKSSNLSILHSALRHIQVPLVLTKVEGACEATCL